MNNGLLLGNRQITLEQLRVFVCVADDKSFDRASRELHRTQSAVTQSLKKLEQILDCTLLERKQGRVLGLTLDGERFLPAAKEILARVLDAVSAIQHPGLGGHIRLGVPDDFNVVDIHGALSRCMVINRGLGIQVTSALSSRIADMLQADQLDVAIFKRVADEQAQHSSQAEVQMLRKEPLCWVGREQVQFDELPQLSLVAFPDGCTYRRAALQALMATGKTVNFAYASAAYENIRSAVSAGLGISVLPQGAVGPKHVVLGREQGFPPLPFVELVMVVRSKDELYQRFAEYLQNSSSFAGLRVA